MTLPADPEDFGSSLPGGALASGYVALLGVLALGAACLVAPANLPFAGALALEGLLLGAPWLRRTVRRWVARAAFDSLTRAPYVEGQVMGDADEPVLVARDEALVLRPLRVRLDDGRVVSLEGAIVVDHAETAVLHAGHRVRVQGPGLEAPGYREAASSTVDQPVLLTMDLAERAS